MARKTEYDGGDEMTTLTPRSLTELGIAAPDNGAASCLVKGVCVDSRQVREGDLFIARDGVSHRGADFIEQAAQQGAVAALLDSASSSGLDVSAFSIPVVVVENLQQRAGEIISTWFGNPSQQLRVIGITGTNGKTSCAHYLAQALTHLGQKTALIGTVGNGFVGQLSPATHTTPDVVKVHELLAGYVAQGANAVVMEVSSHALDQGRIAGVEFAVAAFTNLSRDHLDYHKTMVAYGEAKARLFTDYAVKQRVVNLDDAFGQQLYQRLKDQGIDCCGYSAIGNNKADVLPGVSELSSAGIRLSVDVSYPALDTISFSSSVVGGFNVANLLLTVAVLCRLDWKGEAIATVMSCVTAVPGRMESYIASRGTVVVVDYAHTPDALEKALAACREHCSGKLWVVFGCGGDRDTGKRAEMATIAELHADQLVITSDNPRTEDPLTIISMIVDGLSAPGAAVVFEDRRAAIEYAYAHANDDDWVLVAGKGHEDYQEVMGKKLAFSDRELAKQLVEESQL